MELLGSPLLERLERLDMELGDEALRCLSVAPEASRLEELITYGLHARAEGARYLAESTTLVSLRRLRLSQSCIGSEGAVSLVRLPILTQLEELSVSDSNIEHEGAMALVTSPHPLWLHIWLGFESDGVTDDDDRAMTARLG